MSEANLGWQNTICWPGKWKKTKVRDGETKSVEEVAVFEWSQLLGHIGDGRWVVVHKQRADSQPITPAGLACAAKIKPGCCLLYQHHPSSIFACSPAHSLQASHSLHLPPCQLCVCAFTHQSFYKTFNTAASSICISGFLYHIYILT